MNRSSEFNSDDHYMYDSELESHRRNGVAIVKRVRNAVLGTSKMTECSFIPKENE